MDANNTTIRTAKEVRAWFESYGISVSEWARTRGFPREVVYAVLSERTRGHRGLAHQVAVELGIKAAPPHTGQSPLDWFAPQTSDANAQQGSLETEQFERKGLTMSP